MSYKGYFIYLIQLFVQCTKPLTDANWSIIFTDGSKNQEHTTFAVVQQDGSLLTTGYVFSYCSVFTAEILAVKLATDFAKKNKGEFLICTDSRSTIEAVQNINNHSELVTAIRNNCIQNANKIKLMWVPGHAEIHGNEAADAAASNARMQPLYTFPTAEKWDISKKIMWHLLRAKSIEWESHNHFYRNFNPNGLKPIYPPACTRQQSAYFVRLRMGHTKITHEHLLNGKPPPACQHCNQTTSVNHILNDCPILDNFRKTIFRNITPTSLLKNPTIENLAKIEKFIKTCNLSKFI